MSQESIQRSRDILYVAGTGYQCTGGDPPANGIQVSTGTTPAYGTWVEMLSDVYEDIYIIGALTSLATDHATDMTWTNWQLGLGASTLEWPIYEWNGQTVDVITAASSMYIMPDRFPFPLYVKAGNRLSCRAAGAVSSIAYNVSLMWVASVDLKLLV